MRVLKVDKNKLNIPYGYNEKFFETLELPDGSVNVNVWNKRYSTLELKLDKHLVAFGHNYGLYDLTPSVTERKLVLTVAVTRPSERYFKIYAICANGVFNYSAQNYKEVNEALENIF